MQKFFSRLFPVADAPEPIPPGIYQGMFPQNVDCPNRLHLRVESDGTALLLLNASTVLHLNNTAAEHIYYWLQGRTEDEAAQEIARRYNTSRAKAAKNQHEIREQISYLADAPDLDPVLFIGLDRTEPYAQAASAPYRLDCALTYRIDRSGGYDPLARARVEQELSTSAWKEILRKAWEFGIPHVTFTGGEPCLRDDLAELIEYSEKLGQVTGVLTDGKRFSDQSYLAGLDRAGLDHLLITYEPGNQESLKGLEAALATEIYSAVHLQVSGQDTLSHLDGLKAKGVTAVSLTTETEELEPLQEARDHAAALGLDLIWDLPVPYSARNPITLELERKHVGDGRGWLYVEPDGDVLPSQGIDVILGNVQREAWQTIWEQAQTWTSSPEPGDR